MSMNVTKNRVNNFATTLMVDLNVDAMKGSLWLRIARIVSVSCSRDKDFYNDSAIYNDNIMIRSLCKTGFLEQED